MLMNNLDPEVAERPDDLVVYGGTGRAARRGTPSTPSCASCASSRTTRRCSSQSGKPVGVFRTHEWAPRVLIANSNLVGTLGHLGRVPRAGARRADDVRPDDRRLVDLHRHARASSRARTRRSRRWRVSISGARCAGCTVLTAGLGGMGGAQPLAVTMNEWRGAVHRGRRAAGAAATRDGLRRPGHRLDLERGARAGPGPRPPTVSRRVDRAGRQRGRDRARACASRRAVRCGHRPDLRPRCPERLCAGRPDPGEADALRAARPRGIRPSRDGLDGRPCPGDARLPGRRRRSCSTTATTSAPRRRPPASATRSTSRASCPHSSGPSSARERARSGGRPCRAIRRDIERTDEAILDLFPDDARAASLDPPGPGARAIPGAAGAHLLAGLRRAGPRRAALQRAGASGEVGAPIVIGRDHLDAGSVASP